MRIENPIIPGFHPDPSICRVGQDFYLVTSSFEYFPGVPLYHSRDLTHWQQIGHCLTRPSQLPLEGARASGGIYAPTIRYADGWFTMITTNVTGGGHFLVRTRDPRGPWSEPLWLPGGGIDPSLLFDDDGQVYFSYTNGGQIVQCLLDIDSGQILSPERVIWGGTGGQFPEAPHLYHLGEWYYLLIAEGGTEYGHMITMARSTSPWGPFEPAPSNPILSHRSTNSPIQATGHGDLVMGVDGRWWLVFLGIRPHGYPPGHHMGRETFLAPVTWDAQGWPVVAGGERVALHYDLPDAPPSALSDAAENVADSAETVITIAESVAGDADTVMMTAESIKNDAVRAEEARVRALPLNWNFLRNPAPESWAFDAAANSVRLWGRADGLDTVGSMAWLGLRQEDEAQTLHVTLRFTPQSNAEEAGLVVWMNERHHAEIFFTRRDGQRVLVTRRRIGSLCAEGARVVVPPGPIRLGIVASQDIYRFTWATPEGLPHDLAEAETRYFCTETAGGFTGVYFGLYAAGNGAPCAQPADFQIESE